MFQKAGLVWTGLGEEAGADGEQGGGAGGLTGVNQWMAIMAEHMAQETSRVPFLWPGHLSSKLSPLHTRSGEWHVLGRARASVVWFGLASIVY